MAAKKKLWNYNKRWDFGRWVKYERQHDPTNRFHRKKRGTKTGRHK